jgi:hypothetical protein
MTPYLSSHLSFDFLSWSQAHRAYLLWKARQVADAAASFAAPVMEGEAQGEVKLWREEAVPKLLRHRVAEGGRGLPGVLVVRRTKVKETRVTKERRKVLRHAVQSLKPGVFEELMEMMG